MYGTLGVSIIICCSPCVIIPSLFSWTIFHDLQVNNLPLAFIGPLILAAQIDFLKWLILWDSEVLKYQQVSQIITFQPQGSDSVAEILLNFYFNASWIIWMIPLCAILFTLYLGVYNNDQSLKQFAKISQFPVLIFFGIIFFDYMINKGNYFILYLVLGQIVGNLFYQYNHYSLQVWLNYTASNLLASLIYSAAWYYIDFDDLTIENFWNGFTAHFFKVILVLLYVFTFYVIREISNVAMNDGSHIFSIFMLVLANQMLYYIYDVFINKDNGMFYNIGYYLINSDQCFENTKDIVLGMIFYPTLLHALLSIFNLIWTIYKQYQFGAQSIVRESLLSIFEQIVVFVCTELFIAKNDFIQVLKGTQIIFLFLLIDRAISMQFNDAFVLRNYMRFYSIIVYKSFTEGYLANVTQLIPSLWAIWENIYQILALLIIGGAFALLSYWLIIHFQSTAAYRPSRRLLMTSLVYHGLNFSVGLALNILYLSAFFYVLVQLFYMEWWVLLEVMQIILGITLGVYMTFKVQQNDFNKEEILIAHVLIGIIAVEVILSVFQVLPDGDLISYQVCQLWIYFIKFLLILGLFFQVSSKRLGISHLWFNIELVNYQLQSKLSLQEYILAIFSIILNDISVAANDQNYSNYHMLLNRHFYWAINAIYFFLDSTTLVYLIIIVFLLVLASLLAGIPKNNQPWKNPYLI